MLTNASASGLVAGVFTRDISRADLYIRSLEAGIVNVNKSPTYWEPRTPFGGYAGKRSGLGRLGEKYMNFHMKTVVVDVTVQRKG